MKKFLIILFSIAFIIGCNNSDKTGTDSGTNDFNNGLSKPDMDSPESKRWVDNVKLKKVYGGGVHVYSFTENATMMYTDNNIYAEYLGISKDFAIYQQSISLIDELKDKKEYFALKIDGGYLMFYRESDTYQEKYDKWMSENTQQNPSGNGGMLKPGADPSTFPDMKPSDIDLNNPINEGLEIK